MRLLNPALLTLPNMIAIGAMLIFVITLMWAATSLTSDN